MNLPIIESEKLFGSEVFNESLNDIIPNSEAIELANMNNRVINHFLLKYFSKEDVYIFWCHLIKLDEGTTFKYALLNNVHNINIVQSALYNKDIDVEDSEQIGKLYKIKRKFKKIAEKVEKK